VSELIIDGGSCTNVASMTPIDKHQVSTEVHPTPYTLQWLKQRSEVTISKQSLISFLVGPYCGEVLCDVLPMDVCHIFRGCLIIMSCMMGMATHMPLSLRDVASL